jgi:hypothetical protein
LLHVWINYNLIFTISTFECLSLVINTLAKSQIVIMISPQIFLSILRLCYIIINKFIGFFVTLINQIIVTFRLSACLLIIWSFLVDLGLWYGQVLIIILYFLYRNHINVSVMRLYITFTILSNGFLFYSSKSNLKIIIWNILD